LEGHEDDVPWKGREEASQEHMCDSMAGLWMMPLCSKGRTGTGQLREGPGLQLPLSCNDTFVAKLPIFPEWGVQWLWNRRVWPALQCLLLHTV
jgi:hypothetical protein